MGLNSDLSKKESFKKLECYIKGFSAQYGVFLVFNVHCNIQKWKSLLKNVEKYYSKIENVEVMGIDLPPKKWTQRRVGVSISTGS